MKKINQCTITLTRSCNLRCSFCYARGTQYDSKETVVLDDLKQIIDFSREAKIDYIVLTGGEPTLYQDLNELIQYIKQSGMKVAMATNGILLSDLNVCERLIQSGIDYIDISLKGFDETNFRETTGVDLYFQSIEAIKNLSILNANFTCSMVLTKDNIKSFIGGVEQAFINGAKSISFTFEIENNESQYKNLEYLQHYNPLWQVDLFIAQIDRLNLLTHEEWWIEACFPLCMFSDEQLSILKAKLAKPCQIRKKNGITFDGYRNLIPCNMYYNEKLGQFSKDFSDLKEFRKHLNKGMYKKYLNKLSSLPSMKCYFCRELSYCRGGCPIFWSHFSMKNLRLYKKNYTKSKYDSNS